MSPFLSQFYDGKFGSSPSTLLGRLLHRICSFGSCGLTGRAFNRGLSRTLLARPNQTSCVTLTHIFPIHQNHIAFPTDFGLSNPTHYCFQSSSLQYMDGKALGLHYSNTVRTGYNHYCIYSVQFHFNCIVLLTMVSKQLYTALSMHVIVQL